MSESFQPWDCWSGLTNSVQAYWRLAIMIIPSRDAPSWIQRLVMDGFAALDLTAWYRRRRRACAAWRPPDARLIQPPRRRWLQAPADGPIRDLATWMFCVRRPWLRRP